MYIKYK